MAISNEMKAQIEALDQAKSNSSDAQNVMKIADGALGEGEQHAPENQGACGSGRFRYIF